MTQAELWDEKLHALMDWVCEETGHNYLVFDKDPMLKRMVEDLTWWVVDSLQYDMLSPEELNADYAMARDLDE